jgi:ACT domain-containing protein
VKFSEEELRQIALNAINELGEKASPELVKKIVAKAVDESNSDINFPKSEAKVDFDRAILTSFGLDRPGVVAKITNLLFESNCSLQDISQKIMGDFYTIIMIVDLSSAKYQMKELSEKLQEIANEMNIKIFLQHENIFRQMHRI